MRPSSLSLLHIIEDNWDNAVCQPQHHHHLYDDDDDDHDHDHDDHDHDVDIMFFMELVPQFQVVENCRHKCTLNVVSQV